MAYATRTDLVTLSIPAGALSGISAEKQDAALEAASREADGYLNIRYQLPLTEYGSDLKRAVCDIAALILMKARGFNPETADAQMFLSGRKDAISWLEKVAAGKADPVGITDSSVGNVNAADLPESQRSPFVVQPQERPNDDDSFWREGSSPSGGGVVGPPRRRGW